MPHRPISRAVFPCLLPTRVRLFLLGLGVLGAASGGLAQVSFTGTYTENFDALASTGSVSTIGPQVALSGPVGWSFAKVAGNETYAARLSTTDGSRRVKSALLSLGASGATERALGAMADGVNTLAFGVALANATDATIDTITVSFTTEFWRTAVTTTDSFTFAYGLGGGAIASSDYLTSSAMTADARLNAVGPAADSIGTQLDGNIDANRANVSISLSSLNWTSGQQLYLRWTDLDGSGVDGLIAIDDFSITTSAVPEPGSFGLIAGALGLLVVGGVRRPRRRSYR